MGSIHKEITTALRVVKYILETEVVTASKLAEVVGLQPRTARKWLQVAEQVMPLSVEVVLHPSGHGMMNLYRKMK